MSKVIKGILIENSAGIDFFFTSFRGCSFAFGEQQKNLKIVT